MDQHPAGGFNVEIVSEDGSEVYFRTRVQLQLFLLALGFGGLILFTWNIEKILINTTNVGGVTTTLDTIGYYLDSHTKGDIEQGDLQPASGNESTGKTATITADYLSDIYYLNVFGARPIPKGAKVRISRDEWKLGATNSFAYQFAILEGAAASIDANYDRMGALLVARPGQNETAIFSRAWSPNNYDFKENGGRVPGSVVGVCELKTGRILLVVEDAQGVKEYTTRGGCDEFERVKYPGPTTGSVPIEALIWSPKVEMASFVRLEDQETTVHLAVDGEDMFSREVTRGGISAKTRVGKAPDGVRPAITVTKTGVLLVVGDDAQTLFQSKRLPCQWQPVERSAIIV